MSRAAHALFTATVVAVLLGAGIHTWVSLANPDPRGRMSWAADSMIVGDQPRDLTVFLPACDVAAVALHPQPSASGMLRVDLLLPAPHGSGVPTRVGGSTVRVQGNAAVPVLIPESSDPWRRPLTLRLRAVSHDGVPGAPAQRVSLDLRQPVSLILARSPPAGMLACAFDAGDSATAMLVALLLCAGLAGYGVLAARLCTDAGVSRLALTTGAAGLTGSTVLLYLLVVPAFEPPDELAHFQYARLVATTGQLPREVPPPTSEWRASSYEWVQQPLYYIGAAGLLHALGLDLPAPVLRLNPRSRLQGGTEPTIFHRGRPPRPSHGHTGLVVLRLVSALMAVVTAVVVARLVAEATGDRVIGLFTGAGLGLVPQWCAVMGGVSTDPPATLLAALAVAAIARLTSEERGLGAPLLVGLLVGAAWAIKATTAFLVPMALLACLARTPWRWPDRTRQMTALMVGLLLSAGWIPLRGWILFGDPQASAFKKALLEAGGFVPVAGPMPWTADFWLQLRPMVFESFWARFGSLGAGPFPGARVWTIYAAGSALLALLATLGTARAITARPLLRPRLPMLCALGTVFGVAAWAFVNLVPRADMVVHWTPRHVLPLTAPVAVLIGLGATRLRQVVPSGERVVGVALGMLVVALALANLAALRATVLMFHFGY